MNRMISIGRETVSFEDRSSLLTKMRNALKPTNQKRVATFNQAMRGARGQIEPRVSYPDNSIPVIYL